MTETCMYANPFQYRRFETDEDYLKRKVSRLEMENFELSLKLSNSFEKLEMPEKYIINENVTILFWKNGEKTMIRRCEGDEFNPRLAFLTAFFQHYCGMSRNKANRYLASLEIEETKKNKYKKTKVKNKGV